MMVIVRMRTVCRTSDKKEDVTFFAYTNIIVIIDAAMVITEIQCDIDAIEENAALYEETNFDSRADAIDFIDFHIIDRIEGLLQNAGPEKKLGVLKQRAEKIRLKLENIDIFLFEQLLEKIRAGIYNKSSFEEMVGKYIGYNVDDINDSGTVGYDNLDVFINGLLSAQAIPVEIKELEPEMVFFQKTPARIMFKLVALAKLGEGDVFFDLGSGLGQVAIMVNLISGIRAIGIEYDPAYCDYASACAAQLNLSNIEFINADARKGDYSLGTVFFMYTPFAGGMLQNMLEILHLESLKRTIKIFTYGPCSAHVARQNWLNCVTGEGNDPYQLCEFKSVTAI